MRYAVCVESDVTGRSTAHAVGLPGCFAAAANPQAALDGLFAAIPDYWTWLRRHGLGAPGQDDLGEVTLGVIEFVRDGPPGAGALFEYETTPLSRPAVESTLARLAYSRADLLAVLADLPATEAAPDAGESVGGLLAHLALTEHACSRLLGPPPPRLVGREPLAWLEQTRAAVVAQMRALPEEAYGHVFLDGAERWNLRKLLRRLIEHEREHTAQVAALRGVPLPNAG